MPTMPEIEAGLTCFETKASASITDTKMNQY